MPSVALARVTLIALTALFHDGELHGLNTRLPALRSPSRTKFRVVVFVAFVAHAIAPALDGAAPYAPIA